MTTPSIKITQMPVATTVNGVDYLQLVQNGSNVKSTITNFLGNLNSAGPIRVNPIQFAIDFSVGTKNDPNAIFADGSTNRIGIGTSLPLSKFHVNGNTQIGSPSSDGILVQSSELISYTAVNQTNLATLAISASRAMTSIACDTGVTGLFSLPTGNDGQFKTIIASTLTVGKTITITLTGLSFTTITMSLIGNSILLQYNASINSWCIISLHGATVA